MSEAETFQVRRKEKFATIPTKLVRDTDVDPYAIATYVALDARTSGNDTEVWPSWNLLAAESHQSMGRLSKSLQWLEDRGWISVERRYDADGHRKVNKYTLYWTPHALIPPDEIRPDSTSEDPDSTGLNLSDREEEAPSEEDPQKKTHPVAAAPQTEPDELLLIEPTPRQPIKDTLVELFGEPSPNRIKLYERITTYLMREQASPDEIRRRAARIVTDWGPEKLTLTSLETHWSRFDGAAGQITESDVRRFARATVTPTEYPPDHPASIAKRKRA